MLSGVPSIVFGAFGFTVMVALGLRASLLAGIITVSLFILPIMVRAMDEVLRLVPLRAAGRLLCPGRRSPGDRLSGGAAPVPARHGHGRAAGLRPRHRRRGGGAAYRRFHRRASPTSLLRPAATLPLAIFFQLGSPYPEVQGRAYASALILTLFILIISLSARWLSRRLGRTIVRIGDAMEYQPHIRVRDLNVYYGAEHVLKNISLDIPDQKITAIIGPSGCGKTTLLKSFNRLIDSVEGVRLTGRILVDNEDILDPRIEVTHIRKKMGLLLQKPYPLPMSIYDNIAYGPRIHGTRERRRLDEIVETFLRKASLWEEVKDRLHKPAAQLSLGQQQRLCLARGLAVEPEIILGDEPTSALDPQSSQRIEQTFFELKKDYTIVVVTHILRQARRMADYVVFLYLGELVEHGPAEEVFENPRQAITREYIKGLFSLSGSARRCPARRRAFTPVKTSSPLF